jgi:hypothetical protein
MSRLAPPIPAHFGPFRRAALEEAQDGWCAVCDLPIPSRPGKARGRYTCGKPRCTSFWAQLCKQDQRHRQGQHAPPSGLIHRRKAG